MEKEKKDVPLRTADSQAGCCGMQPKAKHSLRAQAQLSETKTETVETFELVKVELKLLREKQQRERERGRCQDSQKELTKEREFSKRTLDAEVDDPGKKERRERWPRFRERTLDAEVDDPGLKKERRERWLSRDPPTRCSHERREGHSQHYRED
ncbi:hypothetical protein TNCV_4667711 [Trichonephila clavipes]|nr:hypothetical protein TNCV_4667711 [Trichonephila clavipes]